MLRAINQFETEIRAERQTDGIIKAKEKGVHFGAAKKLTENQIEKTREMRKTGVLIKNLMDEYKLSKASVYRYFDGQAKTRED
jgi:DNA invertase Pin-like site-specific DNA recombinase